MAGNSTGSAAAARRALASAIKRDLKFRQVTKRQVNEDEEEEEEEEDCE